MIRRNVKSMTNMVKTHSRKEWVPEVVPTTHLIFSNPSLVATHLVVRIFHYVKECSLYLRKLEVSVLMLCAQEVAAAEAVGREGERM